MKRFILLLLCLLLLAACTRKPSFPTFPDENDTMTPLPDIPGYSPTPYVGSENSIFQYPEDWPEPFTCSEDKTLSGELTILTHSQLNDFSNFTLSFEDVYPGVKIEVISCYSGEDPYGDSFFTKLSLMTSSGEPPDIVNLQNYNPYQALSGGDFEDLYAYIDNDTELNREDFYENILEALETDGELNFIIPRVMHWFFTINKQYYNALPQSVLQKSSLTMDEVLDLYDYCTTGMGTSNPELELNYYVGLLPIFLKGDRFVDYKTSQYNFGTDYMSFADRIMSYIPDSENEPEDEVVYDPSVIFNDLGITYTLEGCIEKVDSTHSGRWFIDSANGKKMFTGDFVLAISKDSANKELSWELIKYIMLVVSSNSDYLTIVHSGIPIYRPNLFSHASSFTVYNSVRDAGDLTTSRQEAVETTIEWLDARNKEVNYYEPNPANDQSMSANIVQKMLNGELSSEEAARELTDYFSGVFGY